MGRWKFFRSHHLLLFLSVSCAPRAPAQVRAPADTASLPPAGYGTLRQDDVALRVSTHAVQLRVIPLDEGIIRLLTPDTYGSFTTLLASRRRDLDSAAAANGLRRPQAFLVTFFAVEPLAAFTPDDVTITSQNRFFRPLAILPLSPRWSELRLAQRETQSAIYLYEDGIALDEPLQLTYGGATDAGWVDTVRLLERERARVFARAGTLPR